MPRCLGGVGRIVPRWHFGSHPMTRPAQRSRREVAGSARSGRGVQQGPRKGRFFTSEFCMTRPTNRKLRAGFHMEPAAVILEAVGVTENMDVARQVKWVGSPFHSAAKWRFLKFRRSEHDSMLPSPGEVKAAPTRPLGRRYAASRPRNDAVQSPSGAGVPVSGGAGGPTESSMTRRSIRKK